jgi:hypothetical protein
LTNFFQRLSNPALLIGTPFFDRSQDSSHRSVAPDLTKACP